MHEMAVEDGWRRTQDTLLRRFSVVPVPALRLGTTDQAAPFHDSMSVWSMPAVRQ
jgi:hypothetical protein